MLTTAIIAAREFLEAFLIIGIFFGLSRKLRLKKEPEIVLAAFSGILATFILVFFVYWLSSSTKFIFTEDAADLLEGYLLVFSGIFIAYVIFSLHNIFQGKRNKIMDNAKAKLEKEMFDFSLFLTIVFLVVREGFEIALFTTTVSFFSTFLQNIAGLTIGFGISVLLGIGAYLAYDKFPFQKIFKTTEYIILLIGASLVQHGATILMRYYLQIDLSRLGQLQLSFLPDEDTVIGHLLQGLVGIDRELSLARIALMAIYIVGIYIIFLRKKRFVQKITA